MENYHKLKSLLIVKQILLVSTIRKVKGAVWRTNMQMRGREGFSQSE